MAFSLLVHNSGVPTTPSADTTGAKLIILFASYDSGATVSDNKGNTWTALTARGTTSFGRFYYCINPTVGTGHTFSVSLSYCAIFMMAFSAEPFEYQAENGAATTGTSLATGSITETKDNSLVVSGIGLSGNGSSPSVNFGTIADSRNSISGVSYGGATAYIIETAATSRNLTWSWTTSVVAGAAIAVFRFTSSIKKVNGVAYASIKKISGVSLASVKKVAGLA